MVSGGADTYLLRLDFLFSISILGGVLGAMYKVGIPLTYFLVSNDSYHLA